MNIAKIYTLNSWMESQKLTKQMKNINVSVKNVSVNKRNNVKLKEPGVMNVVVWA